jgi:hypothetical protein
MSNKRTSGSSSSSSTQETKLDDLSNWVSTLYDPNLISDDDLKGFYDEIAYHGFDRKENLTLLRSLIPDHKLTAMAIILCALRGPKKAAIIPLPNKKSLQEMGIYASGGKGTKRVTCQKITATTADLAAFYLKRLNVPKKLPHNALPGWLQFPSAGSIDLPPDLRKLHYEFSKEFSPRINGEFNEQIYQQMIENSYLDKGLKLFE